MSEPMDSVKSMLKEGVSPDLIKSRLVGKGYLESDIDSAIDKLALDNSSEGEHRKKIRGFIAKEVLDRIGYGLVSHPFLNILFLLSGASIFLIGLINGLRTIMSLFFSSFLREFSSLHDISKKFISTSGILYGFSFLFLALGVAIRQPALYALAFLVGSLGVVAHGEIYSHFLKRSVRREKMGRFLSKISSAGILITVISILISGYIIDLFPLAGKTVTFMGMEWRVYGYLIVFEITAMVFILSGFVLSRIKQDTIKKQSSMLSFLLEYFTKIKVHSSYFFNNKAIILLSLTILITGLVQIVGNSYYGIFMYQTFKNSLFGGFTNIAVIFSIAVLFSLFGPWITKKLKHHIGITPLLVFGTLLSAMLPLSLVYNPNIFAVMVATAMTIIGTSILGMAQGFFTQKLLTESERNIFFSFIGAFVSIPLLIVVPIGAYLAQSLGMIWLFKAIIYILGLVAAPLFFAMVVLYEKQK